MSLTDDQRYEARQMQEAYEAEQFRQAEQDQLEYEHHLYCEWQQKVSEIVSFMNDLTKQYHGL